jgi:prolyl-tRNA editing enzyme YbaK/EbsC (Cys-tRNA(Pro) deacylase)
MRRAEVTVDHPVLLAIRRLLTGAGVPFREVQHAPTFTSEESARARGEELRTGGKALLLKTDDRFRLFVLPADRKLDSAAVKRHLGVKKTRFANADELKEVAGLVPGSVPPFGPPILPFELFVDEAIRDNERIAFNAGSLTDSIILATADYLAAAKPSMFAFSIAPPERAEIDSPPAHSN